MTHAYEVMEGEIQGAFLYFSKRVISCWHVAIHDLKTSFRILNALQKPTEGLASVRGDRSTGA